MYPFIRFIKAVVVARRQPPLSLLGTHVSQHLIWPWDLDPFNELNNGRTLTLFDLGRFPLGIRTGLSRTLKAMGWGLTVAGNTTRYRRRLVMFDRVEMRSRCIGWDARFFYMEQSMWKGAECTSHILVRSAIISRTGSGIVPTEQALLALGEPVQSPPLPTWVQAWIAGDAARVWPPQM